MKTLFAFIALFSFGALSAQTVSSNREPARSQIIAYPTAAQASAADLQNDSYYKPLTAWTQTGNTFKTTFTRPFDWANRQVLLGLQWASADYTVRVNGQEVGYAGNGNIPAEFNITRQSQEGQNTIEIEVSNPSQTAVLESWKNNPAPALGDGYVMSQPTMRIRDVATRTWRTEHDSLYMSEIAIAVKTESLNARTSTVWCDLISPTGATVLSDKQELTLQMRGEDTLRFLARIADSTLWNVGKPKLYTLRLKTQYEGRYQEYIELKLGLRSLEMQNGRMLIDDTPVELHAKEVSPQITTDEIVGLSKEGVNTLRLLPGALSPSLYDTCDSLGMLVIPQAAIDTHASGDSRKVGGNPSNDPAWKAAYIERTEDCYNAAKRHPSVIAFSLATRSSNGINLYESYLNLKKSGDPRPMLYPDANGEWNSDKIMINDDQINH